MASYKKANLTEWEIKLKEKELILATGILGKIFGSGQTASNNIAGISVIIGFIIAGGITFYLIHCSPSNQSAFEIWKYIGPIITGALGYLFGKGSKES